MGLQKRYDLYKWVIENENLNSTSINYIEFGVTGGQSFNWFWNKIYRFYGFDTFTDLPEDWGSFKKGMFNNNNKIPQINDARGKFYPGLFQQTVYGFLPELNNKKR